MQHLKVLSIVMILSTIACASCYRRPPGRPDLDTTPITNNPRIIDKCEPTLIPGDGFTPGDHY